MTRDKLTELIHAADLSPFADDLNWLVQDSIRLVTHEADMNQLEVGESRIGGIPDLPEDLAWPEWEGLALSFVAQIRLSDLSRIQQVEITLPKSYTRQLPLFEFEPQTVTPKETASVAHKILPKTGILYFFSIDDAHNERRDWVAHRNAWRVIYHKSEEASGLIRRARRADVEQPECPKTYRVSFWSEMTLPPADAYEIQPLRLTPTQQEDYRCLLYDLEEAHGFPSVSTHRLLGYPMQIQNNMQEECQLLSQGQYYIGKTGEVIVVDISIAPSANELAVQDWKFLLQVENHWFGSLYYWMPCEALEQQEFSKAWLVQQYD